MELYDDAKKTQSIRDRLIRTKLVRDSLTVKAEDPGMYTNSFLTTVKHYTEKLCKLNPDLWWSMCVIVHIAKVY